MSESISHSPEKTQIIEYIVTSYTKIFELDEQNQAITQANLEKMGDEEIAAELELISGYLSREKSIYQNAMVETVRAQEALEKEKNTIPTLSF